MTDTTDLVVVGAGILGCAHAVVALRAGQHVTVLERDATAVGASVRNFGHICTTAQPTALQPIARAAREEWLRTGASTGLDVERSGTLVLARTRAQLELLEQFTAARGRPVQMLTHHETVSRLGGLGTGALGSVELPDDLRVDPRTSVGRLAAHIDAHPYGAVRWRTTVRSLEQASAGRVLVRTSRGDLLAHRVVVCVGHDLDQLYPDVADEYDVRRCRLSMLRLEAPLPPGAPALLTPTSLLRYGGFIELAGHDRVRSELEASHPHLLADEANVMATQHGDGSLIVGDSHHDGLAAPPFMPEQVSDAVLGELGDLLGVARLHVLERWQGVYARSPRQAVLRHRPLPDVEIVTVTTGIGMTLSFGLAVQTLAQTLGAVTPAPLA